MACTDCGKFEDNSKIYITQAQQPFCEQCGNDNVCVDKLDARCVVYHSEGNEPTHLINLGLPNGSDAETIFEKIDDLIGSGFNTPIVPVASPSVLLTVSGLSNHHLKGEVKLSLEAGNGLLLRSDGLYSKSLSDGRVKVDEADQLDYLEEQVIGGTDGIVSNSVVKDAGQLQVQPSIDIVALLSAIKNNPSYAALLCQIIAGCVCSAPSNVTATVIPD